MKDYISDYHKVMLNKIGSYLIHGSYLIQLRVKKGSENDQNDQIISTQQKNTVDMIKYNIVFKIRTNYGRAKVIFSSPLQLENKCKIKLLILVELTEDLDRIKNKINIQKVVELPDSNSFKAENVQNNNLPNDVQNRKYGVIFELNPSKIFYVPLYFAYNCRLYIAPQSLKYAPALVFDIKGYNLRKDDVKDVNCKRLPNIAPVAGEDQENKVNHFIILRKLIHISNKE